MKEIIIGLLGGGALVQLLNVAGTLRQSRRSLDSQSLGNEVAALEKTITLLQDNFEREVKRHQTEVAALRAEIVSLRSELDSLRSARP